MLDLLLVTLFAAAMGEPAALTPQEPPAAGSTQTAPAAATAPEAATTALTGTTERPTERRVCRREVVTGTSLPRRICRTVTQEETALERGQGTMEQIQRRGIDRTE